MEKPQAPCWVWQTGSATGGPRGCCTQPLPPSDSRIPEPSPREAARALRRAWEAARSSEGKPRGTPQCEDPGPGGRIRDGLPAPLFERWMQTNLSGFTKHLAFGPSCQAGPAQDP